MSRKYLLGIAVAAGLAVAPVSVAVSSALSDSSRAVKGDASQSDEAPPPTPVVDRDRFVPVDKDHPNLLKFYDQGTNQEIFLDRDRFTSIAQGLASQAPPDTSTSFHVANGELVAEYSPTKVESTESATGTALHFEETRPESSASASLDGAVVPTP